MKRQSKVAALFSGCFIVALIGMVSLPVPGRVPFAALESLQATIQITVVPAEGGGPDRMETIAGTVSGATFKDFKVVIFCRTNTWYVQPYVNAPYTSIDARGKWTTETHLGVEYAALLVEPSYKPPATTDTLPEVGGAVAAITTVAAKSNSEKGTAAPSVAVRKLRVSGFDWVVKSSQNRVGPGPNYFSDHSDNVAVDARGRLHLRITQRAGRWYCAEVISERSFGYGTYRFYLESAADRLDPRVVLGLFTWSDSPAFNHREIDIEISRWGQADNQNGQFVVQPYTNTENIVRFEVPLRLSTTHYFTWKPGSVFCQSLKGHSPVSSTASEIISERLFTTNIPKSGDENARINLWLLAGRPTSDGETEIIINKFEFLPSL
jgi:hypothetical protein